MPFGPFDIDSMKKTLIFKDDLVKETGFGVTAGGIKNKDMCIPKPHSMTPEKSQASTEQNDFYKDKNLDDSSPLNPFIHQPGGIFANSDPTKDTVDESGNPKGMALCGPGFSDSDAYSGCCLVNKDPDVNASPSNMCPDNKDTNLDYKLTYKDSSNIEITKVYDICHKSDLTPFYRKKEPGVIKFLMYACFALIILLVIAVVGCSYEFWLHYGCSIDCLYYQSKCNNRGKRGDKATLLEFIFPDKLTYYPYQPCLPCDKYPGTKTKKDDLVGGGDPGNGKENKIVSTFAVHYLNNIKCISIDDEYKKCKRPFPYNIADYAEYSNSQYLKTILKAICFFFIIPLLFLRKCFSFILSGVSSFFQKHLKKNNIARSFAFLLFSGLLAPALKLANIDLGGPINTFANPFSFFSVILSISTFLSFFGYLITWVFVLRPKMLLGLLSDPSKSIQELVNYFPKKDDNEDILSYYSLFSTKLFYPIFGKDPKTLIFNLLKNILLILPFIFLVVLCFSISLFMYTFSGIYFAFTSFFQLFYYPLSNKLEFFDLIKSHGTLLTVVFCILVFVAGSQSLKQETRGMMGFVLALIIFFALFKSFKH